AAAGAFEVLRTLVATSSPAVQARLAAHPGLGRTLAAHGLSLPEPATLEGLLEKGRDVAEAGTLAEAAEFARTTHGWLCAALRLGNPFRTGTAGFLTAPTQSSTAAEVAAAAVGQRGGAIGSAMEEVMTVVWGLLQRSARQMEQHGPTHPATAGRLKLGMACVALARLVLTSGCQRVVGLIHVRAMRLWPLPGARRNGGGGNGGIKADDGDNGGGDGSGVEGSFSVIGMPMSALVTLVQLARGNAPFEMHHPHPLHIMAASAANALAEAAASGDAALLNMFADAGVGLVAHDAVAAGHRLLQASRAAAVEATHLCDLYPAGRAARVALLDRLLTAGHNGLCEQVVVSGLVTYLLTEMLPDTAVVDVVA
ncbi:unnamed protein product, partial [Phaeothamnion confervicola]